MTFVITPARPGDVPDIAELVAELERYYGGTQCELESMERREAQVSEALFGTPPAAQVLLARSENGVVGMATYTFLWPAAGTTKSLFVKELYVRDSERRQGAGRMLLDAIADQAAAASCSRIEWMADHNNVEAQRFYARLGFRIFEGKVFYRVETS